MQANIERWARAIATDWRSEVVRSLAQREREVIELRHGQGRLAESPPWAMALIVVVPVLPHTNSMARNSYL